MDLFTTDKVNLEAVELGVVRYHRVEDASTLGMVRNGVVLEEAVYESRRFH